MSRWSLQVAPLDGTADERIPDRGAFSHKADGHRRITSPQKSERGPEPPAPARHDPYSPLGVLARS